MTMIMTRRVCISHVAALALVCAALAGCGTRVFFFQLTKPGEYKASKDNAASLAKKHVGSPGVLLLAEDYLEHDLGHSGLDWSLFHIRVRRYLVLDPKHEKMTTYELTVDDNEELTRLEIVVTPPGKPPRRYSSADLIKQDKEKGKTLYKFAYPDMTNGTLIEVRREVRTVAKDNVLDLRHTMWLSHTLPCEKARISYSYPSRWSLRIKRTPATRPLKRRSYYAGRGKQVVSYELADIPPQRDEAFSPSDRDDGVYVSFSLGYMTMGRRSYEGPKNWKAYAEQFKKYVVEKDAIFSRQVAQTTARVVKQAAKPEDKVRAIVKYVQENIKQAEEWEEKDFADVLKSGIGSPGQITGLTHRMLSEAGIPAQFVLIHSAHRGHFDKRFVTFGEIDSTAVSVEFDGKPTLLFPYYRALPVGLVPPFLQGRTAIRISERGFDGFFTTPVVHGRDNRSIEEYKVRLDVKGSLHVKEERRLYGIAAFLVRHKLRDLKPDELKKELKESLTYADGVVDLKRSEVQNLDTASKPLVFQYEYRIDNLVMVADGEAVMQTSGLLAPTSQAKELWQSKRRFRPIEIPADLEFLREVELRLPAEWTLITALKDNRVSNKFGEVQVKADGSTPGVVRFSQSLKLKRGTHPATELDEFVEVLGMGKRLRVPTLMFQKGGG